MIRLLYSLALLISSIYAVPGMCEQQAPQSPLQISEQRVIFSTNYGDLVFAFYSDVAPTHVAQIIRLTELGLYNSVQVFRIIPGFIMQFEEIHERGVPFSREQSAALAPIKAEFSSEVKHIKGRLSMARWENNPDSAVSSFSILLGNAPHLDGEYTVFGYLESGGSVINDILSIPLRSNLPTKDIVVKHAYVVAHKNDYYNKQALDDVAIIDQFVRYADSANSKQVDKDAGLQDVIALLVGAIIVVGLLGFVLQNRITKNHLVSLLLTNVLVGAFILVLVLLPHSANTPWVGVLLFVGMFLLFRMMSSFEKKS